LGSTVRASTCSDATVTRIAVIRDRSTASRRADDDQALVRSLLMVDLERNNAMTNAKNEAGCSEVLLSTLRIDELETIHGGAHYNCPDADGIVPESYGRYGGKWLGITDIISRNPCQRAIRYDTYNMRNAGPNDWARLQAHERAHARGWDHGQGSPSINPAHNPYLNITGR
jgi:hypothetical protein